MSENKQAQAEEIKLTLDPEAEEQEAQKEEQAEETVVEKNPIDEANLSEVERQTVNEFSSKIDIMESNTVLQYGSAAQKKVSDFSDTALNNVRTKDLGEIGTLLSGDSVTKFKAKYDKAEANVEKVAKMLEDHQITLLKDIALLDELYARNQQNTKELTMYILAGKKRVNEIRENELPELTKKAKESGLPEDAQAANDLEQACVRFEKKLYDLELTRQISIQMAPQIRLVQNNDTLMTEKIQSTLVNTIPLWKNQIVLALGISHSKEAMEAQREVTDMTNTLLKKNAETLHQATVDTAKESERGIVDLETLQHTNEQLISTLEEVQQIQKDGREKRAQAEQELAKIENELTNKLLEINAEKKQVETNK